MFEGKPLVYLDMNVLIRLAKGDASPLVGYEIAYSTEHFAEILRGSDRSVIDVLERLDAVQIATVMDDGFRMTGEARVWRPFIRDSFAEYEANYAALQKHTELFVELGATNFGGVDRDRLRSAVERLPADIRDLVGSRDGDLARRADEASKGLERVLEAQLAAPISVNKMRKPLSTHDGRVGQLAPATALQEIWSLVREATPTLTFEQFFEFDAVDKQGYDHWPMHLGIVGAYMVLNAVGFSVDSRLATPHGMRRAYSDASHAAYAAYCSCLLSEDERFARKAAAIYANRNIGVTVIHWPRESSEAWVVLG